MNNVESPILEETSNNRFISRYANKVRKITWNITTDMMLKFCNLACT